MSEFFAQRVERLAPLGVRCTRFDHLWLLAANSDLHRTDSGGGAKVRRILAQERIWHIGVAAEDEGVRWPATLAAGSVSHPTRRPWIACGQLHGDAVRYTQHT